MCKISTCNCRNINHCICAALGSYVHACAARGLILNDWTGGICNKTCENNQVFGTNVTACNRNCRFLSKDDFTCNVKDTPVYGCGCPEGKYMNENGFCVNSEDCSCFYKGVYIQPGERINNCYCESGSITCNEITTTVAPKVCKRGKELLRCPTDGGPARCGKKCRNLESACVSDVQHYKLVKIEKKNWHTKQNIEQ
ncbi:mucin-2-like [Hypanus sabinus]|uniref:mucin-2-like n=1 Tax=Hypanus sabinus TaxID=79690 RepID=UPI0028C4607E|nr:mucin-2-like [Hypanus sabinus]